MAKPIKRKWVRLRRFLQRLKEIDPNTIRGDGGLMTDKMLNRPTNAKNDSTFIIKDTAVVKPLK